MVSISTQESENDDQAFRPPLDLICVIDKSNSMKRGGRIQLVKLALIQLLEHLSSRDRVSLVEFSDNGKRINPLTRVSAPNKPGLQNLINDI